MGKTPRAGKGAGQVSEDGGIWSDLATLMRTRGKEFDFSLGERR